MNQPHKHELQRQDDTHYIVIYFSRAVLDISHFPVSIRKYSNKTSEGKKTPSTYTECVMFGVVHTPVNKSSAIVFAVVYAVTDHRQLADLDFR